MNDVPADSMAPSDGPPGANSPNSTNGQTATDNSPPDDEPGPFDGTPLADLPGPAEGPTSSGPPTGEIRLPGGDLIHVPPPPPAPVDTPPPADAQKPRPRVKGRIDIADEVIEKVAAAAAYEVDGVADLGGNVQNALEFMRQRIGIGRKKEDRGSVTADIDGGEAELDVAIEIKYGYSIIEVARRVQVNVAHQAHVMLGLKVIAVNVTIDDIEMPDGALTYKDDDGSSKGSSGFSIET